MCRPCESAVTRRAWLLLALLAACTSVPEPPTQVRLQSLLEHPAQFSGRTVEVEGYLAGRWLFASERAESLGDITQAVALFVRSRDDVEPLHGCVVRTTADTGPGSNGSIALEHVAALRRFQPELVIEQAPTLA